MMKNRIIDRFAERRKTASLKDKRLNTNGRICFIINYFFS